MSQAPGPTALEVGDRCGLEALAQVRAPIASTHDEDPSAAGTEVDLTRSQPGDQIQDALLQVPGARVRTRGGLGSFAGLALRGAEIGHTLVMLGTNPLHGPDARAFDLSTMPPAALGSLQVFRGGAPVWLGGGTIGGVLRLVPRRARGRFVGLDMSVASYGQRRLAVTAGLAPPAAANPHLLWHVGSASARNDYPYLDDNQTRFIASDDRELRQRNARTALGNALLHAGLDALGGRVEAVWMGFGRTGGVPGPLSTPTLEVRQQLLRSLASVSYEREVRDARGERQHRVQLVLGGSWQRNRFTDLLGEAGASQPVASNDRWQRGFARAAASVRLAPFLETTLVASLARDRFRPRDPLAFSAPPRLAARATGAAALETRWLGRIGGRRWEVRPSARLEWNRTQVHAGVGLQRIDEQRREFAPTLRLGTALELSRGLAASASMATGRRVPSMFELFGDRAFVDPNPELVPERSRTLDAGLVARGRLGAVRGQAEVRVFGLWMRDLINSERTSRYTVRAANLDSGRVVGTELGVAGEAGLLRVAGSLTALHTRTARGKQLPLRAPLRAYLRPELRWLLSPSTALTTFAEAFRLSYVYLDASNFTHLAGRTFVSAGLRLGLGSGRAALSLRARNLFDVRASDVLARPLPGRQLMFELSLQEGET